MTTNIAIELNLLTQKRLWCPARTTWRSTLLPHSFTTAEEQHKKLLKRQFSFFFRGQMGKVGDPVLLVSRHLRRDIGVFRICPDIKNRR